MTSKSGRSVLYTAVRDQHSSRKSERQTGTTMDTTGLSCWRPTLYLEECHMTQRNVNVKIHIISCRGVNSPGKLRRYVPLIFLGGWLYAERRPDQSGQISIKTSTHGPVLTHHWRERRQRRAKEGSEGDSKGLPGGIRDTLLLQMTDDVTSFVLIERRTWSIMLTCSLHALHAHQERVNLLSAYRQS